MCVPRDFYSLAELQKTPPPQGVDPAKLEAYLSDDDFQVSAEQILHYNFPMVGQTLGNIQLIVCM